MVFTETIDLFDVYVALGRPGLFAIASRNDNTECKVERAVNHALSETMEEAEAHFLDTCRGITPGPASPCDITRHWRPPQADVCRLSGTCLGSRRSR